MNISTLEQYNVESIMHVYYGHTQYVNCTVIYSVDI